MLDPLAFMTAKAHGLEDECQSILEASGLSEEQVSLPSMGSSLSRPGMIVPTFKSNWPTKAASYTVFEEALLSQADESQEPQTALSNGIMDENESDLLGETQQNGHLDAEDEEEAAGWDMGDDAVVEPEGDVPQVDGSDMGAGSSEAEMWSKTSPIAADHVAGGSFESAMQLLNRQVGAVNFKPLEERFQEIFTASRTFLPANPGMPSLVNYVRRTVDETDLRRIKPIIPRDLESISANDLTAGKTFMRTNKLEEGVQVFKRILHTLLVNAVATQSQISEVRQLATFGSR